ncbi:16727_t:CDS:2 [Funneliformis mosseae]|uniref:16727_t:CDS:1 n=1 Tax=Funneliformis mosseae TaxID=27381 RepID=A0A9N9BNW1_FUNMO|nr:16727_t:CDS:2 [Funneliformis mosseae]
MSKWSTVFVVKLQYEILRKRIRKYFPVIVAGETLKTIMKQSFIKTCMHGNVWNISEGCDNEKFFWKNNLVSIANNDGEPIGTPRIQREHKNTGLETFDAGCIWIDAQTNIKLGYILNMELTSNETILKIQDYYACREMNKNGGIGLWAR